MSRPGSVAEGILPASPQPAGVLKQSPAPVIIDEVVGKSPPPD